MFKRRWLVFGPILSDEGFTISYGHKTVYYSDERGIFQIGYENEQLFPSSLRPTGTLKELPSADKALIIDRMLRALQWDGHHPTTCRDPSE